MFAFGVVDLQTDGLKKWAAELQIPDFSTMTRAQLEAAIRNVTQQPNPALLAALTGTSKKERHLFIATMIASIAAGISALLTLFIAVANWRSASVSNNMYQTQIKADAEYILQNKKNTILYEIIEKGVAKEKAGLTFEDIRSKYFEEMVSRKLDAAEKSIESDLIQHALYSMIEVGIIHHTTDNRYYPKKVTLYTQSLLSMKIVDKLSTNRAVFTPTELGQVITNDGTIKQQEFNLAINQLVSAGTVKLNSKGKLYAVAYPPEEKEK